MDEYEFVGRGGRTFSWRDVMTHLRRRTFKRYGATVDDDVLDEALSDAYLDLADYFNGLASARAGDSGKLQFGYALYRGSHMVNKSLAKQVKLHNQERRSGSPWPTDPDEDSWADVPDAAPGPEDFVEETDQARLAREMLAKAEPEQVREWFDVLLTDETERELAQRLGVSQMTAHRRRERARKAVRELAPSYGLVS